MMGLRYRISIIYYMLQASTTRQVNYDIHITLLNIHPNPDHHDQGSPKLTLKDKRSNPWGLNADALLFTDKHLCSSNQNYGIQVMDESCSAGLYVKPLKHLATLWNYVTRYSNFLTVKAATSRALKYASIWYTTKGRKKISPWLSKLLQIGHSFSRLHTIKLYFFFSVVRPTKKSQVAKE